MLQEGAHLLGAVIEEKKELENKCNGFQELAMELLLALQVTRSADR